MKRARKKSCVFCTTGLPHESCRPPAVPARPLLRRNPAMPRGRSYVSPWGFRGTTGTMALRGQLRASS